MPGRRPMSFSPNLSDILAILTTNTSPRPFSIVHRILYPSFSSACSSLLILPSMKVSLTKAFTGEEGVWARLENAGVNERDQRIRPPTYQLSIIACREFLPYSDGI